MRPNTQLDYAVFQLNPTQTRCELHISAQGTIYKLAAGLLQPFVAHLSVAEEQVARGDYTIRLEPPDPGCAGWFTKGTMERFVRFVSTPEVLERVSTIEMELIEIENTIRAQSRDTSEDTQNAEKLLSKLGHSKLTGGLPSAPERLENPAKDSFEGAKVEMEETTKQRLLRALEARRMMLEKELGVALARAFAAGFNVEHITDLIAFAEVFGAKRLWGACSNFLSLCKTRQQSGLWQDDLKLSAAEAAQSGMAFSGNVAYHMGFRENPDLPNRGSKHHDLRRTSLPSDGRLLMGDTGLEKLTRRGSLDELTGEFLQVAARMRSSGMMEGAIADGSNSWQPSVGGGNHSVSGEMPVGLASLGSNNDLLARGHQIMAAWRGHPQSHPLHNVHQVMHGPMHSSLPASLGFAGLPTPPGYSPYPVNPYMGHATHAYAGANNWQIPSHVIPPYWPHSMLNSTAASAAIERGEAAFPTSQKQEANQNTLIDKELHEELTPSKQESTGELCNVNEPPASTQRVNNDQSKAHELYGETPTSTTLRSASNLSLFNGPNKELSASMVEPASGLSNDTDLQGELPESTQELGSDLPVSRDSHQMSAQQELPPKNEKEDESTNDPFHDGDAEPFTERTRRLPIRSSSPSRRSASPLKKVQIGRSGSRRAIRNVNFVAQNIPEKRERENIDRESSESWSDNDLEKDEEPKEQPVRARVQDVIGLFERKKDGDAKAKPLGKEIGRMQSNNSVLKRWTESGAIKEGDEGKESVVINGIRKEVSVASADDVERSSKKVDMSEKKEKIVILVCEENAELVVSSKVGSLSEQQTCDELPVAKEFSIIRDNPLNSEADAPTNSKSDSCDSDSPQREQSFKPDDILESSHELAGRSCSMRMDDDAQALASAMVEDVHSGQERTDGNESLNDGQENEDGELGANPEAAHSKVSARDAKAKAMQELLERRKAASGIRAGKPNPLAEAQLRAEKLRAYKAGLQKSKQEKDEEEKRRIEDLKSQRKERIAARGSPLGASSAQSPTTKQAPQTPPLTINRSSPTVISHKFSSSSPRSSINVSASSLSPNVPKPKGGAVNKLPRTPTGTPKANENLLSRSVPSLSELKKESPKATLAVRSSTGSQRLSQLKKNLKDADPNTSPMANGRNEEKRRSLPLATIRKGIPPAKDIKTESSPVAKKPTKGLMAANKQQRKAGSSPASVKPKKPVMEAAEVTSSLEQMDAANGVAVDKQELGVDSTVASLDIDGDGEEARNDKQELGVDIPDGDLENSSSSLQEVVGTMENDVGYAQIRAPPCTETENLGSAEDSSCLVDDALAMPSEPLPIEDSKETEAPIMNLTSHTDSMACSEGEEHRAADGDKNTEDNYFAPVAHVSSADENSTIFTALDASKEEPDALADELPSTLKVSTDELPSSPLELSSTLNVSTDDRLNSQPEEPYNPPRALPSDSPLHVSKSLPRLHEAIQQAHSPEFVPGVVRPRKTQGDVSGSVRSSKDHAKGFKRLLLLGRKSSRSSTQSAGDWVPASMVSEVGGDDGEDISGSNAKGLGNGSAISSIDNATRRVDKPGVESNSRNSSSKGSRSFFSLSTFRGKSEGKV